jgi:hypothetical protein
MATIDCMTPVCVVCESPFDTIMTVERGRICRPCFIQIPSEIHECTDCGRKDDGTLITLGQYSTGGYRDSICHDCRLEGNLESFIIYKEDEADTYCFYCGNNKYPEHLEQHHDPMHRLSLVTCTSCSYNHSNEIDLFTGTKKSHFKNRAKAKGRFEYDHVCPWSIVLACFCCDPMLIRFE